MANRQYIGARYVPAFANPVEWSSGREFEALTIVTYLGASYTSKKPVPTSIGAPNENPDYWALTGNYNAQVEEYRQEVRNVQTNLNNVQANLDNVQTNLDNVQSSLNTETSQRKEEDTALSDRITTNTNDIAKLKTSAVYINVKNYGAKGDGVTDDTAAIKQAVEDNPYNCIFFPKGTYIISEPIIIEHSYGALLGETRGGSIIKASDNFGTLSMLTSTIPIYRYCVSNVTLDCKNSAHGGISIFGNGNTFNNVTVINGIENGFSLNGADQAINPSPNNPKASPSLTEVINCCAAFCGGSGFWLNVDDCQVVNCEAVSNAKAGFNCRRAAKITNCHSWCYNADYGFKRCEYALFVAHTGCVISNSHFEGAKNAPIYINNNGKGTQINNCYIYATFGRYQAIIEPNDVVFTGCWFDVQAPDTNDNKETYIAAIKQSGQALNCVGCHFSTIAVDPTTSINGCMFLSSGYGQKPFTNDSLMHGYIHTTGWTTNVG